MLRFFAVYTENVIVSKICQKSRVSERLSIAVADSVWDFGGKYTHTRASLRREFPLPSQTKSRSRGGFKCYLFVTCLTVLGFNQNVIIFGRFLHPQTSQNVSFSAHVIKCASLKKVRAKTIVCEPVQLAMFLLKHFFEELSTHALVKLHAYCSVGWCA